MKAASTGSDMLYAMEQQPKLGVVTLITYLFRPQRAIPAIVATPGALWIGLLLVLSAGLAREYDGEYLPATWWTLLVPFAAALLLSSVLFAAMRISVWRATSERAQRLSFTGFFTLFALTAPLAWLYAIPYERFLSPLEATNANLWTLALVALWRVIIMTRIMQVLTGKHLIACFCGVMLFADIAMLAALAYAPAPILDFMGGLRLSERDRLVASTTFLLQVGGIFSFIVWLIGGLIWLFLPEGEPLRVQTQPRRRVSFPLTMLAIASIGVWVVILPFTQREQKLRHNVERDFSAGRYQGALAEMSRHTPRDFPPHWDPPPRPGYPGFKFEDILAIMEVIGRSPPARWVSDIYIDKYRRAISGMHVWRQLDPAQRDRAKALAERYLPNDQNYPRREDILKWLEEESAATQPSR